MSGRAISLDHQHDQLMRRCAEERDRVPQEFVLPVHMDIDAALCLIGNLQLALRHPANTGASSRVARLVIDGLIERLENSGLQAHVELARLGDDPAHDYVIAGHKC